VSFLEYLDRIVIGLHRQQIDPRIHTKEHEMTNWLLRLDEASHNNSATSITRISRSPRRALMPSSIMVMQKTDIRLPKHLHLSRALRALVPDLHACLVARLQNSSHHRHRNKNFFSRLLAISTAAPLLAI
jgi:hypothetical protein